MSVEDLLIKRDFRFYNIFRVYRENLLQYQNVQKSILLILSTFVTITNLGLNNRITKTELLQIQRKGFSICIAYMDCALMEVSVPDYSHSHSHKIALLHKSDGFRIIFW